MSGICIHCHKLLSTRLIYYFHNQANQGGVNMEKICLPLGFRFEFLYLNILYKVKVRVLVRERQVN